jgi:pyrroline-5-carboxylate reductase
MKLGFIGTGMIASILVTGFLSGNEEYEVFISPRNAERAQVLKETFPAKVTIVENNQDVVNQADWIFFCVRPEHAEEAIRSLVFTQEHKIVNLIAGLSLDTLQHWVGPVDLLVHAIPLSFSAKRYGPIVLYPDVPAARELLSYVGEVFGAQNIQEIQILQALTSTQASFYTLLNILVDWSVQKGLPQNLAVAYVSSLFNAFSKEIIGIDKEKLSQLSDEMTPKGLNWTTKSKLTDAGALEEWSAALNLALARIEPGSKPKS